MKVIAQTAALQEALALTSSVVATRTPKPVLQCIKMIAGEGVLTLLATDLEAGCRYQITAVEINPVMGEVVTDHYADYIGRIFDYPATIGTLTA